jgi:ketosteroid isomerase-like protein
MIEETCTRLALDYARRVDFRDYRAFADLFAEDGVLELAGNRMDGRETIYKGIAQRPENRHSAHVCTNITVDVVDSNNAKGTTYLTLFRKDDDGKAPYTTSGPDVIGFYRDDYVKTADGWRIAYRTLDVGFIKEGVSL